MKNNLLPIMLLTITFISCNQEDKFGSLRKSFRSSLSNEQFKNYLEMSDIDFGKTIENTILKDCESNGVGETLKEISKVDACRRILHSKTELNDNDIVNLIENVKSDYKLRKAALCW